MLCMFYSNKKKSIEKVYFTLVAKNVDVDYHCSCGVSVKRREKWVGAGGVLLQSPSYLLFIAGTKFYLWQVADNLNIILSNFLAMRI